MHLKMFKVLITICLLRFPNILCLILIQPHRTPPEKHEFSSYAQNTKVSVEEVNLWTPEMGTNIWEHSGLFEGDIMLDENSRNGLIEKERRWWNATIPFYIENEHFDEDEIMTLLGAMQEYHNRTCIRFRPYNENDTNWLMIKSNRGGCWSSVGMMDDGQTINFHTPNCVRHGVVVHEFMHAAGFFHQQSAYDRDEFVEIVWDNIKPGREHNFKKYTSDKVTDFNVTYDYNSIMHYSSKAFSKNGEITIRTMDQNATIGQRIALSEKDVMKINAMYADNCNTDFKNIFDYVIIEDSDKSEPGIYEHIQNWIDKIIKSV